MTEAPPRAALAAPLALALAAALSLLGLVHPWYDATGDSSIYIRTAQALLAGEGYAYLGEPFVVRPPGFSLLLLPVLHLAGTDFFALNLYVHAFGIAVVALLFALLRERLGTPLALAVAAAVWLNPGFRALCNQTLSDVPGAALLLLCLLVEQRGVAAGGSSRRRDLLLGLLIAAAAYVRTLSLLLAPAILLSRLLRPGAAAAASGRRRALGPGAALLVAVPLLALLPWELRNAAHAPQQKVEELRLHSYRVAMWHADPGDPGSPRISLASLASRVPKRAAALAAVLGSRLRSDALTPARAAVAGAALGCWLFVLLSRRRAEDCFTGGALLVLGVYFGFSDRLALPAYLFVFAAAVEVAARLLARPLGARRGRALLCAGVLGLVAFDFEPRWRWEQIAERQAGLQAVSRFLAERFPPGAALAAHNGRHLSVHLGRPIHTLKFAVLRDGVERASEILRERRVRAVVTYASGELYEHLRARHRVVFLGERRVVFEVEP